MTMRIPERSAAILAFGRIVKQRRTQQGIGQRDVARAVGMLSGGQMCDLESGKVGTQGRTIRRLCSLLGIRDAAAWELRITGRLPRVITQEEAIRIVDLLGVDAGLPDRQVLLAKLRPAVQCVVCGHRWKLASVRKKPRHCRNRKCNTIFWESITSEQRAAREQQSRRSRSRRKKKGGSDVRLRQSDEVLQSY